jgi:hypothetical protein
VNAVTFTQVGGGNSWSSRVIEVGDRVRRRELELVELVEFLAELLVEFLVESLLLQFILLILVLLRVILLEGEALLVTLVPPGPSAGIAFMFLPLSVVVMFLLSGGESEAVMIGSAKPSTGWCIRFARRDIPGYQRYSGVNKGKIRPLTYISVNQVVIFWNQLYDTIQYMRSSHPIIITAHFFIRPDTTPYVSSGANYY